MTHPLFKKLDAQMSQMKQAGLYKSESKIDGAQGSIIKFSHSDTTAINLCANNYLGLAQHPDITKAALDGLMEWGYGMASVRFICGTQELHTQLEQRISDFLATEETILYPSCFDANAGLFETILTKNDAIISDELNHASIIDGVRLCKASRYRYRNSDMEMLEHALQLAQSDGAEHILITTDGVFSMDGYIAKLDEICALAKKYNALVHVDDSHATGFVGENGRGTAEYHQVMDQVDIITSTLGKAMGGASGGFTSGKREIIEFLRQRSRPYLFSNTVAPPVVAGAIKAFDMIESSGDSRRQLKENVAFFRATLAELGFTVLAGDHPIVPIMINEADQAALFAQKMRENGVHVVAFSYPVVPMGKARIRTQVSAAHTREELTQALAVFASVKKQLNM